MIEYQNRHHTLTVTQKEFIRLVNLAIPADDPKVPETAGVFKVSQENGKPTFEVRWHVPQPLVTRNIPDED